MISTGANLYHDLHYALNFTLHRGSPFLDDVELYEQGIIRIYDVLFPATVLLETDAYIRDFLVRSQLSGPVSTSEFHYRLGQDLLDRYPGCEEYSVVARAALAGVPIYTSSPGDSSIGMNIAYHELMNGGTLMIDPNKDVNEVCAIILAGKQNGCVILGGGSPKNFYLQGQPTLWEVYGIPKGGNDYFIQITTDSGRLGRPLRRDAGRSRQLGQGQSGRAARHRRRLLRFDHRVSALLRVRRRLDATTAGRARSSCTGATSSSPTCCARRRSRGTPGRQMRSPRSLPSSIGTGESLDSSSSWAPCPRSSVLIVERLVEQPRVYADANIPNGVVAYMRDHARMGCAVRARARRPAPGARHPALPPRAAARADARDARSRLHRRPAVSARREPRRHRVLGARRALAAQAAGGSRSDGLSRGERRSPRPLEGRKLLWQISDDLPR